MRKARLRIINLVLGTALLAPCPLALAQDSTQPPKSSTPDKLPGKQLIVWSETQKPRPMPQSSDEMYPASAKQILVSGMILTQGSDFFLAAANQPAYRIDNKEQVSVFAGKKVLVSGNVDAGASIVHVLNIQVIK